MADTHQHSSLIAATEEKAAASPRRRGGGGPRTRPKPICKFFAAGTCRDGDVCKFRHVVATPKPSGRSSGEADGGSDGSRRRAAGAAPASGGTRQPKSAASPSTAAPPVAQTNADPEETDSATAAVPKQKRRRGRRGRDRGKADPEAPPPEPPTPRATELAALCTAYPRTTLTTATRANVSFTPSDPDFPYPLATVHLALTVPLVYPESSPATLELTTDAIPADLRDKVSAYVTRRMATARPQLTLAQMVAWTDKNLERLLRGDLDQPASAIVFVRPSTANTRAPVARPTAAGNPRDTELRAIERRFRASWVAVDKDEFQFSMVPTDPEWPVPGFVLNLSVKVPSDYPTTRAEWRLLNTDVSPHFSREILTALTREHATDGDSGGGLPLLATVNWLDRNLLGLLNALEPEDEEDADEEQARLSSSSLSGSSSDDDDNSDDDDQDSGSDADIETSDAHETNETNATPSAASLDAPKSGTTQIQVPELNLVGVGILEATELSVLVSCQRCKATKELTSLAPIKLGSALAFTVGETSGAGVRPCDQCAAPLAVRWQPALMHMRHKVLGHAALLNARIADLLPSSYTATCGNCAVPGTPIKRVPFGTTARVACRACHASMSVTVGSFRTLRIGAGGTATGGAPMITKARKAHASSAAAEGIVPGMPLPREGRCSHYGKSYRWFRFPCCGRAFPCDVCHSKDKPECPPGVRANRMICGFCAKEQPFKQGSCGFCHAALVGKVSSPFWDAGKGTRDQAKMSRNDKRKHSGLHKTGSKKHERVGAAGAAKRAGADNFFEVYGVI
ncbi:hypothetical protein BC828DRAFT_385642 [Blastocladiella britannica]|nr:hypothetical protein BC828DRAFT_385642 [Blastocladiella britannica]